MTIMKKKSGGKKLKAWTSKDERTGKKGEEKRILASISRRRRENEN